MSLKLLSSLFCTMTANGVAEGGYHQQVAEEVRDESRRDEQNRAHDDARQVRELPARISARLQLGPEPLPRSLGLAQCDQRSPHACHGRNDENQVVAYQLTQVDEKKNLRERHERIQEEDQDQLEKEVLPRGVDEMMCLFHGPVVGEW